MPGIPSVAVALDDGTGTFPIDITQYVRLPEGITWSRGRPDQYQAIGPGQLTLTLDNTLGVFTYGGSGLGFGLGPFGTTIFGGGGAINLDARIRLTVAGIVRWTGRIQAAPVAWPTGGDEFSTVTVTAIDDLQRAQRFILRPSVSHEILADTPGGYYPCAESAPDPGFAVVPAAADITGNPQMPNLTVDTFVIAPPRFGDALHIPDESTGVTITGASPGSYLTNLKHATSWTSPSIHFDIVFYTTSIGSLVLGGSPVVSLSASGTPAILSVNSVGAILFPLAGITYAAGLTSNAPHVISINGDSTSTDLWVDGVKVATGAGIPATWDNSICILGDPVSASSTATMTLGHFNFGSKLSDLRVSTHHAALRTDFLGEAPDLRIRRVAGYAGIPVAASLDTLSNVAMGPTSQAGRSVLDIFNDVADATQGIVYVNALGQVANVTGRGIQSILAPTSIIDANFISSDVAPVVDMAEVVNIATGKAANSTNMTVAFNQASRTTHGDYPKSYEWNVSTDDSARDLTYWQINTYPEPIPRVPTVKHDVMTMQIAQVIQMLNQELGKLARVANMPSQNPPIGSDLNLLIEGISETVQADDNGGEWSITINGVRQSVINAWVLGDGFFSNLGGTTKLSF